MKIFETRTARYIDGNGNVSIMKWIPPFTACRALTSTAAVATPSGTVGDWFHPSLINPAWTEGTDYEVIKMGGFWVDMYLCSSYDATRDSMGTVASGTSAAYVSRPGVAPRTEQTITHFRQYLKQRFNYGCFDFELPYGTNPNTITKYAGKGGLITDAHWFEIWIWTRINRWLLRGNTYGELASNKVPQWHGDPNDIGILDGACSSSYGLSVTGGGSKFWDVPISDFCGNRWEFTDGLRLYNAGIYTAYKTVNPFTNYTDGYSHASFVNTGLSISGVTSYPDISSIASYRTEPKIKLHGVPASTTTPGHGGFDGQGFRYSSSGERIPRRGGGCWTGALYPGALYLDFAPSDFAWDRGARAVLVP